MRNEMRLGVAVEDHPLWPKWNARLEDLLAAKKDLDKAALGDQAAVPRAAKCRYDAALSAI